jgi:RNA polymerase sigma-70 factor (ECF subfamily)
MELFAFDDVYVRRLREHDREVEEHFHKYFRALLFAKLRHRLTSIDAIEDVIQEVFERVYARLEELRDGRKLGAFVLAVSNHVTQEWYRREARSEPLEDAHESIAGKTNIEAEFFTAESAARVRRVMERLGERDAAILRAIFLDEGDKEEVCRKFGVDRTYLRVLLHRAKDRFKAEYARKSNPHFGPETFLLDSSLSL